MRFTAALRSGEGRTGTGPPLGRLHGAGFLPVLVCPVTGPRQSTTWAADSSCLGGAPASFFGRGHSSEKKKKKKVRRAQEPLGNCILKIALRRKFSIQRWLYLRLLRLKP